MGTAESLHNCPKIPKKGTLRNISLLPFISSVGVGGPMLPIMINLGEFVTRKWEKKLISRLYNV